MGLVSDLSGTILAGGQAQAQGAQNLGQIQGQAIAAIGQIHAQQIQASAQLWGRFADTVASTLNEYTPEAQAKKKQIAQQTTLQGLQIKSLQDTEQEKARGLAEVETVKGLIQQHQGNIDDAAPDILAKAPVFGQKYLDGVADLRKKFADGLLSQHKLEAEQLQSFAGQLSGVADDASFQAWVQNVGKVSPDLAKSLQGQPYSPELVQKLQTIGMDAKQQIDFRNASVEAFTKDLQQKKSRVELAASANQALGSTLALTPPEKWDEALQGAAVFTPPDIIARYRAIQGQPDAAKQAGEMALTAEQRDQNRRAQAGIDRQLAADAERERHDRAMENRPTGAAAAPPQGGFDEGGLDLAATRFRLTGTYPARDSKQNAAITNKAAAQAKELGQSPAAVVQKMAANKADAAALTQMTKAQASSEAFESKANGEVPIIQALSAKVGRTTWPIFNAAILGGKKEITGDSDTTQLYNAITSFTEEYAKIMTGTTGSAAAASDSARAAAKDLINAKMSKGTLNDVLALMQRQMALTMAGYDVTINHINQKLQGVTPAAGGAGGGSATPPPGARIRTIGPDGRLQ